MYLDDILVYSRTEEEHLALLQQVFELLRQHKLFAKMKKCTFLRPETEYLGHILDRTGVRTDPAKTRAIQDWPQPKDIHDLRSFLGLANYYRRFVHHYSKVVLPLTDLLRKDAPFLWKITHQVAFDTLKDKLVIAPTLQLVDPDLPLRVEGDESDFAIGAVLSTYFEERWHPVAYESRKLNAAEKNYPIHEKELLALVHVLRVW